MLIVVVFWNMTIFKARPASRLSKLLPLRILCCLRFLRLRPADEQERAGGGQEFNEARISAQGIYPFHRVQSRSLFVSFRFVMTGWCILRARGCFLFHRRPAHDVPHRWHGGPVCRSEVLAVRTVQHVTKPNALSMWSRVFSASSEVVPAISMEIVCCRDFRVRVVLSCEKPLLLPSPSPLP